MTGVRSWAVASLLLLALYHAMRAVAATCSGAACDVFIAPSLALPLAVLGTAGVAGAMAASPARGSLRALLIAATLVSTAGPLIALALLRDSPDALVPVATFLFVVGPLAVLAYSFRRASSPPPAH